MAVAGSGRSPADAGSGHSAEPGPICVVPAETASVPNATKPKLTVEEAKALPRLQRRWISSRICGFCEISLMSKCCGAYSGLYALPIIEGVRDKEEVVDLGPPCDMDERRAHALQHYKPRKAQAEQVSA